MMTKHYHPTHSLATQALEKITRRLGISYRQVARRFVKQDETITHYFWQEINQHHPGKYGTVDYCPSCQQFSLWEATPWDRNRSLVEAGKVNSFFRGL